MKALRFYKSRLFWCGVPGLVFLLWVWWDSGGNVFRMAWKREAVNDMLSVNRGEVKWRRLAYLDPAAVISTSRYFEWEKVAMNQDDPFAPPDEKERGGRFDFTEAIAWNSNSGGAYPYARVMQSRSLRVGLWVVVLGYGVLWLGAVAAWRWRKMRIANIEHRTPNIE